MQAILAIKKRLKYKRIKSLLDVDWHSREAYDYVNG